MPRYALLIYEPVTENPAEVNDPEVNAAYEVFTRAITGAGALRGGEALQDISTATTVRVRDGKTLTTDGPFAETKEQFAGFYMIEVADLDAALGWAAQIPGARKGSIEVRPIFEFPDGAAG